MPQGCTSVLRLGICEDCIVFRGRGFDQQARDAIKLLDGIASSDLEIYARAFAKGLSIFRVKPRNGRVPASSHAPATASAIHRRHQTGTQDIVLLLYWHERRRRRSLRLTMPNP